MVLAATAWKVSFYIWFEQECQLLIAVITVLCLGPSLDQYVQDMGNLLFPVASDTRIGMNNLDEGIEKELLGYGDTAVLLESSPCCEEDEGEDLGSVDSISEESGGEESPSDGSETEEAVTVVESDALSDHMLDASADLL